MTRAVPVRYEMRRHPWGSFFKVIALPWLLVAMLYGFLYARADEVAESYSTFWHLDPVQLPYGYWFPPALLMTVVFTLTVLAFSGVLHRRPYMQVGEDRVYATFVQTRGRWMPVEKVREIGVDRRGRIRFIGPAGGSHLIVIGSLLSDAEPLEAATAAGRWLGVRVLSTAGRRSRPTDQVVYAPPEPIDAASV